MDVEDWKVPPEHPDHPTKLGAFDESLDQLDASISSISLPDVELRTGVDRVAAAITAMTALDPESLRGLRVSRFLRQAPWHWWRGELWTLYRFTEAVDTLEEFWSHSWRLAAWSKYVNVLFLKHAIPASLMSLLCAAVAYVLFLMELLPEWTQGPYRCSWCSFSAAGAYVLTMLLSCRQARVFLDIACINQKDARLKALGLLSLGAMLKRSKSLLVLWDATFTTRLWCVFEFGAFLHSHSGTKPRLTVVPPLQGAVCLGCGCLLATMVIAAHWGEDMVEVKSTIGISVAVPSCVLLTHMLRIYWRSIDVMRQQASSFCFEEAKCVCCERDHPQGFCDKEIIARCIVAWFGSIQHFEHRVQAEMEVTLAQQLANAAFSYDRMVQAAIPWIWLQMDVSASHSGDWTVWTRWVELSRALTIVFGILPCIMKFLCHLTFILRAQHCRMWVDVLLSLVIFVPVPVLFSGAITLEEYIVWFLIDHPYGPVYGSLLSLTMWSTITLLLWNCLPMLNLTGGAPPTDADQERS